MNEDQIKVGIGVMILKQGKVLLGRRKGSHGAGEYAFPGGRLEYMESFEDCARREVAEECGVQIKNIKFLLLANIQQYVPSHYVHITVLADWKSGEPIVLEPEKCEDWKWYSLDSLPEPMFLSCKLSVDAYQTKRYYYDAKDTVI